MANSPILNQFGKPYVRQIGLYPSPTDNPGKSRPRPALRPKTYENVSGWQRLDLLNYSRVIRAGVPNIDAALHMKAAFAFADGWHIRHRSKDLKFKAAVESEINEIFYRDCNILGEAHDFHATMKEFSAAMDVDGDQGAIYDFDPVTGEGSEKVMVLSATRIATGLGTHVDIGSGLEKIYALGNTLMYSAYGGIQSSGPNSQTIINDPKSPFDGERILDGIILDRNLARLGVRVLGYDKAGKACYQDIPAARCRLDYESGCWSDQLRGIPGLATAILPIIKVEDFDYYIKQAMILSASLAVSRKSRDGAPNSARRITVDEDTGQVDDSGAPITKKTEIEVISDGINELATSNGEELQALTFERPSMNEEEFIKRTETGFFAKHWPRAMIYADDPGRAFIRALGQQVRMIVWERQQSGQKFARWLVNQRINSAMIKGRIPMNRAGYEPFDYVFCLPGEFSTDEGNDAKMDLGKLGRNLTTHRLLAAKDGHDDEELEDENLSKVDRMMTKAEALAKTHPDWTAKDILTMVDSPFPNPPQPAQPEAAGDGPETKPTKPKPATK